MEYMLIPFWEMIFAWLPWFAVIFGAMAMQNGKGIEKVKEEHERKINAIKTKAKMIIEEKEKEHEEKVKKLFESCKKCLERGGKQGVNMR